MVYNDEQRKIIQDYYDAGNSITECYEHFNIGKATIVRWAKRGLFITRTNADGISLQQKKKPRVTSEETKKKISESQKRYYSANPDKVPYLLNHSSKMSYPEKIFKDELDRRNMTYSYQHRVDRFALDFAFITDAIKLDVEIDGVTHKLAKVVEIDRNRDIFMKNEGWTVIRLEAEYVKFNLVKAVNKIVDVLNGLQFSSENMKYFMYNLNAEKEAKRKPKIIKQKTVKVTKTKDESYTQRSNSQKRVMLERRKENMSNIESKIEVIKNSGIDFTVHGWVVKAAPLIGITPQKVSKWIERNDPELFSLCFRRKVNVSVGERTKPHAS